MIRHWARAPQNSLNSRNWIYRLISLNSNKIDCLTESQILSIENASRNSRRNFTKIEAYAQRSHK